MGSFGKLQWHVQILIVAAVCGGALALFWNWTLQPMSQEIAAKTTQRADLEIKVKKSLELKARYEQFKKEAATLEVQLAALKRVLPQDKEIEHILSQVQQAARNAGLRIQSGVSKPVLEHEVYSEWPMEMQVLGTYHNLGAFLESIKELPRIVNVTKLKVDTRGSSAGGEDSLSATIGATYEATTFVYREVAETAPATTAKAKR